MSTITRELAKLFRKITNSEIDAEGNAHVVLSPADSLLINNARIALASLEAEASGRNPVLAYADSYRNMANHGVESIPVWSVITDLERNIAPLFTVPPAPVSVPDGYRLQPISEYDAMCAAMLQGAEPVTTAYKLPPHVYRELVNSLRDTAVKYQGCQQLREQISETLSQVITHTPHCGNSPVIPDGWVACSERLPDKSQNVLISVNFDSPLIEPLICSARYTGSTFRRGDVTVKAGDGVEEVTHWMPLPNPPKE
ncbi:DUF551 domain-containing protein [Enterobacter kobei]|uniref:DUF551 domain-containing protein n=1 Tax=Enterobacter kobei TaxID=208224 RepID=UPI0013E98067|nr:DUF551 domain-containing protein [Enterobacter kobei]MCA1256241.1 DUF551 domain-containing protein [Enterobacter kobei]